MGQDADRIVESLTNPTSDVRSGSKAYPSPDNSRIAESIDFNSVNNQIDDLVQGAIAQLKDNSDRRKAGAGPLYNEVDISRYGNEVDRVRSSREVAGLVGDTELANIYKAGGQTKEAIQAKGAAEGDLAKAENLRAEREAAIYNQLAAGMGIRPEDVAAVSQQIAAKRPVVEAKLRNVQALGSVSITDDFIGWLGNQLALPSAVADYNAEATSLNTLQSSVDTALKTAQETAVFAQKGIPTITADIAKARAGVAKANADKAVAEADEALAKTSVTFAQQKLANDVTAANATEKMTALEIQQEGEKLKAKIYGITQAESNATRLLKAAELLEKLEKTKGLDVILESADRVMGHPRGTTTRYNFERMSEAQRQNIIAIGSGSLGPVNDPLSALEIYQVSRPGPGVSKETMGFVNYLQGIKENALASPELQRLHGKEEQRGLISITMKNRVADDVRAASRTESPFHELSPAVMLAAPGAIDPKSKLAKVLEPLAKQTGNVPTDLIVGNIMSEFENPAEAGAVISDYYKKNMILRNTYMNSKLFGVTLPDTYHMRRSTSALALGSVTERYGSGIDYDLTDPAQATKFVLRKKFDQMILQGVGAMGMP